MGETQIDGLGRDYEKRDKAYFVIDPQPGNPYDEALRVCLNPFILRLTELALQNNWETLLSRNHFFNQARGLRKALQRKRHANFIPRGINDLGLNIGSDDGQFYVQQDYQGRGRAYIRTAEAALARDMMFAPRDLASHIEQVTGEELLGLKNMEGFGGLNIEQVVAGAPRRYIRPGEMLVIPFNFDDVVGENINNLNKNNYSYLGIEIAGLREA